MKVKSESEITQSCPTLSDPIDCSPPGSSVFMQAFLGSSDSKASAYNAGDPGSIPGLGRSPGEVYGNPLHFLAWEIPWTEKSDRKSVV